MDPVKDHERFEIDPMKKNDIYRRNQFVRCEMNDNELEVTRLKAEHNQLSNANRFRNKNRTAAKENREKSNLEIVLKFGLVLVVSEK